MKYVKFNRVPTWCPYTPKEISNHFNFDLQSDKGMVEYKCVHCKTKKYANINSIRMYIRNGVFTSLCIRCRGIVQRQYPEKFLINKIPMWMSTWLTIHGHTCKTIENIINTGEIVDVEQGGIVNKGLKFDCIRCQSKVISSVSRIKTSILKHKFTCLCRKCVSSVRNNVCKENPRISPNGYVLIQKSMVPMEHLHLFDWTKPVMEHRYRMAVKLNRPLTDDEIVHHIDGNKKNNSIENLELWNKSHPYGQRVVDKLVWAKKFIEKYNML